MAIEDELSSDIAIALLAGKSGPELNALKGVVLKIHASLREVSDDSYTNRASSKAGEEKRVKLFRPGRVRT